MKSIKYLIILLLSLFALESNAQGYKIILKDGRTASVRADETEIITFSKSVSTKEGTMPGYKIILSDGRNLAIGTEETEIFTFTTDAKLVTNISAFETVNVSSITLSSTSLALTEGDRATLTATVIPSNATDKTLVWSSDNTNVVLVDNNGVVTAKSAGTANITASAADGSGVKATCSVTVSSAFVSVAKINLSSTSLDLVEGKTISLSATISPSNATNKNINWTSSNNNVAIVDNGGNVTAISEGTANIIATAADGSGVKATCKIYVESATVYVSSISLSNTSLTLTEGNTKYLTYTISPSNATSKDVTWSSSNTNVASVDAFGMITAKSVGSATITATANDGSGATATCRITVESATVYVSSISLSNSSLSMTEGNTQYLTASVYPSNASNKSITWSSSNTSVATVNSNGMITAKAAGNTTITVKANDESGVKATCSVSVKSSAPAPPSGAKAVDLGLSVKWANMNVGATEEAEYGDYFAWGEISPKTSYLKENYKFYKEVSYVDSDGFSVLKSGYTKYVSKDNFAISGWDGFYDNKEVLDKEDDAAYMNWGGEWRMPTVWEQKELVDKCKWDWTTLKGINGYKVTGPNGNYIFLPTAGNHQDGRLGNVGWSGTYWSSSSFDGWYVHDLYFYSDLWTWTDKFTRYKGLSVRAICP